MKFKNLFFAMMTLVFSVVISQTQDSDELCQSLPQDDRILSTGANHPILLQPSVGENLRIINANLQIDQEIPDTATIEFLQILNQPDQLIILRSLENQHRWQTTNYFFEDVETIWQIDEDYTPARFRYIADDTVWIDSIIGVSREYYFLDLQSGLTPFDYIQFWDEEKYQFGHAQPTYSPDFTRLAYWPNRGREEFNIETVGVEEELTVLTVSPTGEFFTWSISGNLIVVDSRRSLEREKDYFIFWEEYHIYDTQTGAIIQEIPPPEQLFTAHVAYDGSRFLSAKLVWSWDDTFLAFFWQSRLGEFLYIYDIANSEWLDTCFEVVGENLPTSVLTDFFNWTPDNRYLWWSRLSDGRSREEAFNHVDVFAVDLETMTFNAIAQNVGWLTSVGYIE